MNSSIPMHAELPPRLRVPGLLSLIGVPLLVLCTIISFWGLSLQAIGVPIEIEGIGLSVESFIEGIPAMGRILGEMFPPDLSRIGSVSIALLITLQMAFAGCLLGVLISLPLSVCASSTQTPHRIVYFLARGFVSLFRTVPDLIWAIFFVISVGLGPFAGMLALMVDTIGFCGRFFAEAIEEVDQGPIEAIRALGAGRLATLCTAVFPATMPSFVNSSLFSLEKAVRSSVVLGLVGAGGIGMELKVSMDMFRYAEAATIILLIFLMVLIVEQLSSRIRAKIL